MIRPANKIASVSELWDTSESCDPERLEAPVIDVSQLSNSSECCGSSACPKWKAPPEGTSAAKAKTPGLRTSAGTVRCLYHYNHDKHHGDLDSFSVDWKKVIPYAAQVVRDFNDSGTNVMVRQLYYRLFSERVIKPGSSYGYLCTLTAQARREGWFPKMIDLGREIHRKARWLGPDAALESWVGQYRRNRTIGQERQIWLASEKKGQVAQLMSWFGDLGIPILALGGYTSESYVGDIVDEVERDGRPAVLFYVGDADPAGLRIFDNFVKRTDCWEWDDEPKRLAITPAQVEALVARIGPEVKLPGKDDKKHPNVTADFITVFGANFQVELDAFDPLDLRQLYQDAIKAAGWNDKVYQAVRDQERIEVSRMVWVDYSNAYGEP